MLKKKICMLGGFAAGKTSLVQRYVRSIFSEKYLTTVGVKIDKKEISVDGQNVTLLVWDIHGEDEFQKVDRSYMRGMSGCFLVVDGTRRDTLETAKKLHRLAEEVAGNVPCIVLVNKVDLKESWEIQPKDLEALEAEGWSVMETSAKTGAQVEEAFINLSRRMLGD